MEKLKIYGVILFYWILVMNIMGYFALINVTGFIQITDLNLEALKNPIADYWVSPNQLLETTLFALFFGILFILVNELSTRLGIEKLSFSYIIVIKSLIYLLGFVITCFLVFSTLTIIGTLPEGAWQMAIQSGYFFQLAILGFIFLMSQSIVLNFILQTITKFGYKNLSNFLLGKYHNPVIEERIFLFMDLKSSTAYAETLGNIKYSKLIKDCVNDINNLVDSYKAEIYQYVGDEVVLTWESKGEWDVIAGIDIFYAFKKRLEGRSDHYLKKYGVIPQFKAGLHGGKVTVAEIGNIKRDIAYHGDVLNTASRIESICNQYKERLLVSGWLLKKASHLNGYSSKEIGIVQLKGKQRKIDVHAVHEVTT
ncbi:MAG: adenylate/guanylate cyclase domain-containing protein [Bacteroidota bacterium]